VVRLAPGGGRTTLEVTGLDLTQTPISWVAGVMYGVATNDREHSNSSTSRSDSSWVRPFLVTFLHSPCNFSAKNERETPLSVDKQTTGCLL
jgi:hypothetical protein